FAGGGGGAVHRRFRTPGRPRANPVAGGGNEPGLVRPGIVPVRPAAAARDGAARSRPGPGRAVGRVRVLGVLARLLRLLPPQVQVPVPAADAYAARDLLQPRYRRPRGYRGALEGPAEGGCSEPRRGD